MTVTKARARLREKRQAGSRSEILEVTRAVVAREGSEKLTLELVANELGISKQALYYYFPSRSALIFELVVEELHTVANAVNVATAAAETGADALETLIRTYLGHFLPRLELHQLVNLHAVPTAEVKVTPEQLAKVRPINDLLYGETEKRLVAEARGKRRERARRIAFTAHLAAIGMLTMRAVTAKLADPLIHSDEDLVDELVRTFRAAAAENGRSS